jgi:hypothetical protein
MFLPSGQRWVYRFLYRYAIPAILCETSIKGNNLFLTDGDTDEYIPLHDQIFSNELLKNSKHGLCMFHLLVQSWQKDVSSSVPDTEIGKTYGKLREKLFSSSSLFDSNSNINSIFVNIVNF